MQIDGFTMIIYMSSHSWILVFLAKHAISQQLLCTPGRSRGDINPIGNKHFQTYLPPRNTSWRITDFVRVARILIPTHGYTILRTLVNGRLGMKAAKSAEMSIAGLAQTGCLNPKMCVMRLRLVR